MRFKAKKDSFYIAIFWMILLILLATFMYALLFDETLSSKIVGCILTLSIIIVSVTFWFNTYYVIVDDKLLIKYGLINKDIPVHSIKSISRTNTMVAGPAFSTHKIVIHYNYDQIFIAPENEKLFVDQLIKANNTIQLNI